MSKCYNDFCYNVVESTVWVERCEKKAKNLWFSLALLDTFFLLIFLLPPIICISLAWCERERERCCWEILQPAVFKFFIDYKITFTFFFSLSCLSNGALFTEIIQFFLFLSSFLWQICVYCSTAQQTGTWSFFCFVLALFSLFHNSKKFLSLMLRERSKI